MSGLARLRADLKKLGKHAALIGAGLGVLCHLLPPDYRQLCEILAKLCSP